MVCGALIIDFSSSLAVKELGCINEISVKT